MPFKRLPLKMPKKVKAKDSQKMPKKKKKVKAKDSHTLEPTKMYYFTTWK